MMEIVPLDVYERAQGVPKPTFKTVCTNEIMATVYPPIMWVVPGYLPEGFSVLAGRQKLGKTWLAIDFAAAVAAGGYALGAVECEPGNVLYLDMENGQRRIQRRIVTLFPNDRPDLSRLQWATEAHPLNKGFIDACETWRVSVPNPRLIVIDVLQRIKPPGNKNQNAYESDYSTFADLQSWAAENRIAVLGLHHTKKGGADDPLEALSGSNGLSAVADTTLVLDRDQNGTTLYVRGRDVEEKESAIRFEGAIWSLLGDASAIRRSSERNAILDILLEASEPMTPTDVAGALGKPVNTVKKMLHVMAKAGEVTKEGRGLYRYQEDPGNLGNFGNFEGKA